MRLICSGGPNCEPNAEDAVQLRLRHENVGARQDTAVKMFVELVE